MLKIKSILTAAGIKQSEVASHLNLSPASVAQIVNHGQWPKSLDELDLMESIQRYLASRGITATLEELFEEVAPERANAPEPVPPVVPEPIENSEQEPNMLLRKQTLSPAARKAFGLFRDPFDDGAVQSHEDVFASPDIRYVREAQFQTARHGGFVAVIGESGAGKSTLRRDLIDRIARESQPVIVIEPYVLGMEDNDAKGKTLKAVAIAEAIINTVAPLEGVKRSSEARFRQLHRVLRDSRRAGNRHVLIIEEAHGISLPTLKHLKRFHELEDGFNKLLSIVLLGQPELKMKLSEANGEVREVVQRCEQIELLPLDTKLEDFLKFKLERVGKPLADVIDSKGIDALRDKLTITQQRHDKREPLSLLYPLAVGNLLTAAMNLAAEIGVPAVTADVVKGV